ncbi:hypothetical protein [Lentzea flaviverrucosa]|uniref:Glutathione synthase/RimK-type ligase, ATP-grasp superfamily n=1 Tax=Lentzea flaviverrucosa TaxID=200379 RepID=A0A1H9U775_9PSEU|nr:hypothetical protein [Lentzea flaviverrucosa]RDI33271.1 hypothetical protein DFR72_102520 [Lentzea flaviverrucosa]SES05172.1 hypothetical protein SAMN05216195_108337 [Lentzea flaviverrucosa]
MPSNSPRPSILYVSNLSYPAKGRRYCDEDIYLTSRLRQHFNLAICHPEDATALMPAHDTVVIRNSGPTVDYAQAYLHFREQAKATNQRVYNPLTGKGDMAGKQYLIDLTDAGFPVIPTIGTADHLDRLPRAPEYVVKPKAGADSHGLEFVSEADLQGNLQDKARDKADVLVQPKIDFRYEVSFYFVDHDFQYALNAPDPAKRWELSPYTPSREDLEFAQRFVDWNDLDHGIQRVDACRTRQGELLLVELEDLNPYLSLDRTPEATRTGFVSAMAASILHSLG